MAHRGGRIIDTDLRISRALHVSNDSQEREQASQDDPDIKAHQSFSMNIPTTFWQASASLPAIETVGARASFGVIGAVDWAQPRG